MYEPLGKGLMLKASGLERNAVESICSERWRAFSVLSKLSAMRRCLRLVRISRAEEQTTEAVTASQARTNCSRAMARPMKMTRRGMTMGRTWVATRLPTGDGEERGTGWGCFQDTA